MSRLCRKGPFFAILATDSDIFSTSDLQNYFYMYHRLSWQFGRKWLRSNFQCQFLTPRRTIWKLFLNLNVILLRFEWHQTNRKHHFSGINIINYVRNIYSSSARDQNIFVILQYLEKFRNNFKKKISNFKFL